MLCCAGSAPPDRLVSRKLMVQLMCKSLRQQVQTLTPEPALLWGGFYQSMYLK